MNASKVRAARYVNLPNRKVYRKKRQKFKRKCKPCYICADRGHSGNFCPQVNTCSVCSKEESKNNVEEDHTSLFCLKCGGTGHGMFSCTNDYDPEDLKECTKINAVANELQPVSICFKCKKGVHSPEAGEKVNKPTSGETSMARKDAVDKSIEGKSQKTRRRERRQKMKPVMPTSNVVQSLPTMSMIGNTIPRHGQYYGNPGSNLWLSPPTAAGRNCLVNSLAVNQSSYGRPGLNVWLSPPVAAARNCLVNSPALNQSSYGRRPGLNVWLPPPAAAARNYLETSPAVNQSSYQTGFHFYHCNTNYTEVTHVPPNSFRPCSLRPHEMFHQGTQIPGTPQNMIQLPHQNFTHQIRTHVPQSTFDSRMGVCQQPEFPHHVSNHQISALLPHQTLQHQLPSHRTWMAPPGQKPYS